MQVNLKDDYLRLNMALWNDGDGIYILTGMKVNHTLEEHMLTVK